MGKACFMNVQLALFDEPLGQCLILGSGWTRHIRVCWEAPGGAAAAAASAHIAALILEAVKTYLG